MRIFYASHQQGNHNPNSKTWYNNLYLPLCDIAKEVVPFDFDLTEFALHQDETIPQNAEWLKLNRPMLEEQLLTQIKKENQRKKIDVFFSYFASSYCSKSVIEEIKSLGILTVNWFCNASYQFHLIKDLAPAFDYCLVPEKFRLLDYQNAGANPIYCQEAANPNVCKNLNLSQDIDASFVGTRYADRYLYLRQLFNVGVAVQVYGQNWQRTKKDSFKGLIRTAYELVSVSKNLPENAMHPFADDAEMLQIFNRSKINLGFSVCGDTHTAKTTIRQVRLRDFEVPMSAGFYMSETNPELADFFEPEKEIVFFSNAEELADKAKFYLKHETLRNQIRMAAHKRALNEHSWQKRLKGVFGEMGELKV
ncbi:MAG: glycosyltransferase [Bacteroidetes bacterium]|nr:glycosyltransferase [Bacteroidota bacterium]